jgi:RHH-type proline utilization regulon transcriptional repressor/proline dehydrogenase/delta 1-pyrroline-5-carboxylate dehydrogenase
VVQAYGKRARHVIDWLHTLARAHDRHFMVRLVKGAYWDTEIKRAQIGGFADFPVFTRKPATDVSYICCAARLLGKTDRLYPQFATHNAHSVAAIMELAGAGQPFEFQRLHGMGEALHARLKAQENTRCRIYAPVGAHRDLLAYLVRRLLENGANSSFVNQIVDVSLPASVIAGDPFDAIADAPGTVVITTPDNLYAPRRNSRGHDLTNTHDRAALEAARAPFQHHIWRVGQQTDAVVVANPADPDDIVGHCHEATQTDIETALAGASDWSSARVDERARILRRASDLLEERCGEVFAAISREAGKTTDDCVLELREAVDFLRFYAAEAERLGSQPPRGIFACISPWNFPLAIFTGQVAAALAAGNGVVAKPAEQTPITASLAVRALHDAGVPANALRFLPGGGKVGASLTSDARIDGVCFTGSTATAQAINRAMATNLAPGAPLIAETGGLNAMIVDSTALPEQAVADIVASAFRSAGQRCSALRVLYLQEDIAEPFTRMLLGAMATLSLGDPWEIGTDMGPVIDEVAHRKIHAHIATARAEGRLLLQLEAPGSGFFIGPAAIRIDKLADLSEEIFGPVLHIATFDAARIEQVVDDINASGYGLTFGMHSRIDGRIQNVTSQLKVGNIYINRNQIGAVVGTQPFGGEGLSGTGPKAGGPRYVGKFMAAMPANHRAVAAPDADIATVQSLLDAASEALRKRLGTTGMPGPTGESNQLSSYPRGTVLCLGPSAEDAVAQAAIGRRSGCASVMVAPDANGDNAVSGFLARNSLASLRGVDAVILWGEDGDCRAARQALARRAGPIVPLIISSAMEGALIVERHICVDTTAAGGNASLLTQAS